MTFCKSLIGLFTCGAIIALTGCGQSGDQTASSSPTQPAATQVASTPGPAVANQVNDAPTTVVSQFLELVRSGDTASNAGELLTARAQAELKRIGRSVQPIGSPDANFRVTRAEPIEGEQNAMLVQSIWTEPGEGGTSSEFEVVWAVQLEQGGWRISGLAMEVQPGAPATVIDFEDGDLMAKFLAEPEPQQAAQGNTAPAQAATPSQDLVR